MKIGEFITQEIAKAKQDEDIYVPDVLRGIALAATQKYGHKIAFEYIGGHSDPGYNLECYAFGYVENGDVTILPYNYEDY